MQKERHFAVVGMRFLKQGGQIACDDVFMLLYSFIFSNFHGSNNRHYEKHAGQQSKRHL